MNIFDLHNDIVTSDLNDTDIISKFDSWRKEDVFAVCAIWSTELNLTQFFTKADFLIKNKQSYAIEDMGIFQNIDECFQNLSVFPKYCSLTWNYENKFAGGALSDCGLKVDGQKLIEELNNRKIVVDVSHLNEQSFYDVLDASEKVIASHSCLYDFKEHKRNLKNTQIKALVERGGIIGLTFVPDFIRNNATIFDVACMIEKAVELFGIEHFCIGSDFFGVEKYVKGLNYYKDFYYLAKLLKDKGFLQDDIHKLFYKNAQNYFYKQS